MGRHRYELDTEQQDETKSDKLRPFEEHHLFVAANEAEVRENLIQNHKIKD